MQIRVCIPDHKKFVVVIDRGAKVAALKDEITSVFRSSYPLEVLEPSFSLLIDSDRVLNLQATVEEVVNPGEVVYVPKESVSKKNTKKLETTTNATLTTKQQATESDEKIPETKSAGHTKEAKHVIFADENENEKAQSTTRQNGKAKSTSQTGTHSPEPINETPSKSALKNATSKSQSTKNDTKHSNKPKEPETQHISTTSLTPSKTPTKKSTKQPEIQTPQHKDNIEQEPKTPTQSILKTPTTNTKITSTEKTSETPIPAAKKRPVTETTSQPVDQGSAKRSKVVIPKSPAPLSITPKAPTSSPFSTSFANLTKGPFSLGLNKKFPSSPLPISLNAANMFPMSNATKQL